MIQRSSEAGNEVACDQSEAQGRRFQVPPDDVFASLPVVLCRDRVGLRFSGQEPFNFEVQKAKVMLCPTHLESSVEISRGEVRIDVR